MKPLAPNTLLQNRYLIVHLIGKGGMGEVYLAVDQRLGSAIALKRTLHADDSQLGDAFEREARTLARLRHPALPKVSDHFIENENQFLVMEHISGDDLSKRLAATQKPFPLSWGLFWADQLLDALAYLHSHEPPIIHRDIKPQNLKLTDDNNIVLLDFGLSKNSTGQTGFASGSGSTGSVVGYTPHYAPMEQIRGTGTNPRSDIYSLSATLYQLLTNVVPPDALSRADFLLSGKTDPIAPINEINHEIPKSISDVVLKGMSISQDQRFADAREMQRILRETYAKMQSDQAEKTIAFNAPEESTAPAPAAQTSNYSNDKTEQFAAPVMENQPASKEAMGAQTIPFGMVDVPLESEPATPHYADKTEQIQNFDATFRMDEFPQEFNAQDTGLKTHVVSADDSEATPQSGVKTEVFGSDFGATDYVQNNGTDTASTKVETSDFNAGTDENIAPSTPNFTGDKTVPLIEFEKREASVDLAQTMMPGTTLDPAPVENFAATSSETRLPTNDNFAATNGQGFKETAPNYDSQPTPSPTPATPAVQPKPEQKKSKGVLFGILGALFGLVILAAAGGGIAWYLMQPTDAPPIANTATPTPEITATPTPEATPDQSLVNSNSGNTANSEISNTDPANTNANSAVNAVPSPTRTVTTQTPITQPTRQTSTPRPSTPKSSTPKPEPKSTLRGTTIPQ